MAGHPTGTGSLSENWLKEGDSFMAKVLTSWNEIAADLGKGVRTVKMSKGSVSWEANRFPARRTHSGSVLRKDSQRTLPLLLAHNHCTRIAFAPIR